MTSEMPSIHVEVRLGQDRTTFDGSFFIDAINFLCGVEQIVRANTGMKEDVDTGTARLAKENMKRLMEETT